MRALAEPVHAEGAGHEQERAEDYHRRERLDVRRLREAPGAIGEQRERRVVGQAGAARQLDRVGVRERFAPLRHQCD